MANVNIEDELDEYLKIGGLLYSWISLKDLPDATFPGVLRELVVMDFPLVMNAEVILPDQAKMVKQYKSRLRKMTAAQKDIHGGFRINVDAQVAEHQLIKVLQELDLELAEKLPDEPDHCRPHLTAGPQPVRSGRGGADSCRPPAAGTACHRAHERSTRNSGDAGSKAALLFGASRTGGDNKREIDVLTLHAADLLPVEMPWRGTPNSPFMLFETPYRQLIPFSPFDSGLGDANMLIMAKSGGGKTFIAQL